MEGSLFLTDPAKFAGWADGRRTLRMEDFYRRQRRRLDLLMDGGEMMTKPYAASGRYVEWMSTYCAGCRYSPGVRSGADACPFTTLYWDFLSRHRATLRANRRMSPALRNLDRIDEIERRRIREQARALRTHFDA